ncbi:TonB-dependent siderophore receptor, partial [Porphyromonas sp.]|uniref:TonB-dependent receptor plug domain-containing protein n=1 Tax=Porphyromonas sp. TaxID=1924944 RepID=UPI0025E3FE82
MTRRIATALQLLILLLPATLMAQEATPAAAQTDSLIWASVDSLSVFNLDEVVVTGTGTNYLLKNAPVQTEIINAKTLESYGSASLTEILSGLIPSIDFSHSDMGTAMQMGGLSSQYILILLNGKRLMSDLGGQTNLDMIDPTRIERIEVVKGA